MADTLRKGEKNIKETKRDIKMYILVNEDIKMSKGKLAGQVGHAVAVMFYKQIKKCGKLLPIMEEYMNNYQKKIILYCPQEKLEELEGEGYIAIRDKGFTELEENTLTCVNVGLVDVAHIDKELEFIKELRLVR